MKKSTKLTIRKVTLRDLDEKVLDGVAGGISAPMICGNTRITECIFTCNGTCPPRCP